MRVKGQNLVRSITLLLMICLANMLVFASVPSSSNSNLATSGILSVFDQDSAFVNGNIARDGTTILSGSEIKTDKSGARINLNGLGSIDLAAGTSALLTFTSGQITLNISTGEARLVSIKGVTGVLTTPEGEVLKTDPSMEVSTVGNNVDDKDYKDANGKCIDANKNGKLECDNTGSGGLTNGQIAAIALGVGGAVLFGAIWASRNVSPTR